MVYKEYKAQARTGIDFTALAAMPALVEESLSYTEAERLISIAAWPCAIVEDGGAPTGFVMPAIPDEFFIALTTVKGVSSTTAEFQHLLNHPSVLAARGITIDDAQRYTLLRETASALAFLHKHGVCVGDISPKNLLFSLTPHEAVYFIDCDAMRINTVSALPQVETPGWNAPAGEELATIYTDTYKLGLLALRLLTGDQDTTNPATPPRHHTGPAAPNHHRHTDQTATPTPAARSLDLRPGPRHRTSPTPHPDLATTSRGGHHRAPHRTGETDGALQTLDAALRTIPAAACDATATTRRGFWAGAKQHACVSAQILVLDEGDSRRRCGSCCGDHRGGDHLVQQPRRQRRRVDHNDLRADIRHDVSKRSLDNSNLSRRYTNHGLGRACAVRAAGRL